MNEKKISINYYVAESMEFHNMGNFFDNITSIEDAISLYLKIEKKAAMMGPGIGIIFNDSDDSFISGPYSIYENGQVSTLEFYPEKIQHNTAIITAARLLNFELVWKRKLVDYGIVLPSDIELYSTSQLEKMYSSLTKFISLGYLDEQLKVLVSYELNTNTKIDETRISPTMSGTTLKKEISNDETISDMKGEHKMEEKKQSTYKQMTRQEYLKEQQEKRNELGKKIITMATAYTTDPSMITDFLRFQARFYTYSVRNTMLIHQQNPHSTFLASYADWKKKGYSVLKGAQSLKILVPVVTKYFKRGEELVKISLATPLEKKLISENKLSITPKLSYKIGSTFDISQTNCPKSDYPKIFDMGYDSKVHNQLFKALQEYSDKVLKYPVRVDDVKSISLRGYCDYSDHHISISNKLESSQALSTLAHEIGHAIMHEKKEYPSVQKELEADCFCIMLSERLGISIEETRKSHLSQNFTAYMELLESLEEQTANHNVTPFEQVMKNVLVTFNKSWGDIKQYIFSELEKAPTTSISNSIINQDNLKSAEKDKNRLNLPLETSISFSTPVMVKIIYSELGNHEKLKEGTVLSLKVAEQLIKSLDESIVMEREKYKDNMAECPRELLGYYKTKFELFNDSNTINYEGRVDIGDGSGGLINHINTIWTLEYEQQLSSGSINKRNYNQLIKQHNIFIKDLWNEYDEQYSTEYMNESNNCKQALDKLNKEESIEEYTQLQNKLNIYLQCSKDFLESINQRNTYFKKYKIAGQYNINRNTIPELTLDSKKTTTQQPSTKIKRGKKNSIKSIAETQKTNAKDKSLEVTM